MENEAEEVMSVDGVGKQNETVCDKNTMKNEAAEATSVDSAAVKQEETAEKRRFWLCIFHGCIDNTTLEDLECTCCGVECQVVEYDSEVEYEPE